MSGEYRVWISILFFLILLCALLVWMRPHELGPGWAWLRIFFPSWRFFDDFDRTPRLFFRVAKVAGQFTSWKEAIPQEKKRSLGVVFVNPQGNLKLAAHSAVDRLLDEVAALKTPEEIQETVSYRLVEKIVRAQVPGSALEFQFKVSLSSDSEGDLVLSPLITNGDSA